MKRAMTLIYLVIASLQCFSQNTDQEEQLLLTQFPGTKKWGYVHNASKTSRIFLPTRITATSAFDAVGLGTGLIWGKKERVEFNWAVPPQYDKAAKDFNENLACVVLNGKTGFIDRYNRFIIPPVFDGDDLSSFRFGLAPICKDGKYGYINKIGNMCIPNTYEWAGDFKENMTAPIKMDGRFGAIDIAGNVIVPCKYKLEEAMTTVPLSNKEYRQAVKKVKADKESGIYDPVIAGLDSISSLVDKHIADSSYTVPLPDYTPVLSFSGASYGLKKEDNDTAWIFPPEYAGIDRLDDSLYLLQTADSLCGVGDTYGRIVIPSEYDNVSLDSNSDVIVVEEDSLYGLYNTNGLLLSPAGFDLIGGFEGGKASVWVDLQHGLLNDKGEIEDDLIERLFAHAETCEHNADWRNARRLYKRIICIEPTFAMAYHNLGILDINIEEYKSGMKQLSLANKLDPENELIAENLKQAKKDRKERRWNRVVKGLEIAGTVVGVAATTYAAIEGTGSSATAYQPSGAVITDGGAASDSSPSAANEAAAVQLYQKMEDNVKRQINSYQSHQSSSVATGSMTLRNIQNAQRNMREHRSSCRKRGIIIPKSSWEDKRPGPIRPTLFKK